MDLYRICTNKHAGKLTASGCENRWNLSNQWVIYASQSRSLATLEMVVRRNNIVPSSIYQMMIINLTDDATAVREVLLEDLPANWRMMDAIPALQNVGASWYESMDSLVLKVPSVVIPQEFNYVLNTAHPAFKEEVKLIGTEAYYWDRRLL